MATLQELIVRLRADTGQYEKGMDQAGVTARKTSSLIVNDLSKIGGKIVLGAFAAAAAGAAALGGALAICVKNSTEAQRVTAQLNAVIKSTGGAAGVTADMADELAVNFAKLTGIEDETILAGENMLLTFTSISKDVFPLATQTILDMSVALGTDATQSAIQLGKALQDPINGVTALRRVGVNFNDEQQNTIKNLVNSNRLLDAQKLILKELQTEFGGSAAAAGNTFAGAINRIKAGLDMTSETIGLQFMPTLTDLANKVADFVNSAQFEEWATGVGKAITDLVNQIPGKITSLINTFNWFKENIWLVQGAFTLAMTLMGAAVVSWAITTVKSIAMVGVTKIIAIGGAFKGLLTAFTMMQTMAPTAGAALSVATTGLAGLTAVALPAAIAIAAVVLAWNKFIPKDTPQKIASAIKTHNEQVLLSSKTYKEYTDEMIRANHVAGTYTNGMHRLADAYLEGKLKGDAAIKAAGTLATAAGLYNNVAYDTYKTQQQLNQEMARSGADFSDIKDGAYQAINPLTQMAYTEEELAEKARLAEEAIKAMSAANSASLGLVLNLSSINRDYKNSMADLQAKAKPLADEYERLRKIYGDTNPVVRDAKKALDENKTAMDNLTTSYQNAMAKIAWDLFVDKLKGGVEGFTAAEYNMAIEAGVNAGIFDQATADMALSMEYNANQAILDAQRMSNQIELEFLSLDGKSITLHTYYLMHGVQPGISYRPPGGAGQIPPIAQAEQYGGWVSTMTPTIVGERGPELIFPKTSAQVVSNDEIMEAINRSSARVGGNTSNNNHSDNRQFNLYLQTTQKVDEAEIVHGFDVLTSLGVG